MTFASNDLSEAFISYTGYRRLSAIAIKLGLKRLPASAI